MLNPLNLNDLSYSVPPTSRPREFPLLWHNPGVSGINPAFDNLRGAWELDMHGAASGRDFSNIRPCSTERAAVVFHHPWEDKRGLDLLLLGKPILKRYAVDPACRQSMRSELAVLCITDSVVFPDIIGLANELKERFS